MNQIPPHNLWIGTIGDLHDLHRLYDLGINAIMQLAYEEASLALPHDLIVCRFPLLDGEGNAPATLDLAISTLTHLLERKFATLVCCHAGMGRSPAIAAAAMSRLTGKPFATCVQRIAECRPIAIHPRLLAEIGALCPAEL